MHLTSRLGSDSKNASLYAQEKDSRFLIIFLLGFCILVFHFISERKLFSEKDAPFQPMYLYWNGEHLAVSQEKTNHDFAHSAPPHITPLLFQPIPINEANLDLLTTVPGIGPRLGAEIITTRSLYGPFRKDEDLQKVSGIGRKRMLQFTNHFSFR